MRLRPGPALRALFPSTRRRPASPRRSRRRRARAVVLTGLSLIGLAFLGMAVAVETVKPEWRDPEYGHRLKQLRRLRETHPDRPLVVALGSSRTQMGLSPADMGFPDEPGSPLVYNFAQAGAGPFQMRLTLLRLLDAGLKPDFLLVELFPAALAADGTAEELARGLGPRLGAGDLRRLAPYTADPAALRRRWAADRVASWHSLRLTLMSHWQPGWLPWDRRVGYQWEQLDDHGCTPFPCQDVPEDTRRVRVEQVRGQYAAGLAHFRVGATSDRALREIVARCRAEGIGVAFHLMPEGPSFRGYYPPATRATVSAYVTGLSGELGVPVFDAADGFAEDEFADGHHLLRPGAARFSRRLADGYLRNWARQ